MWAISIKYKNCRTKTNDFSNILRTSKRKPGKLESEKGAEFYNNIFQNFLEVENIQKYSGYTDKRHNIAYRVIKTKRSFIKEARFSKNNADWISELPSVINDYNKTSHSPITMTPIQAFEKSNEKEFYSNLHVKRQKQSPKIKLGDLVRISDLRKVCSKGDNTNYSYKLYAITEVIHDTIPSYRINYLPERYNHKLLL